MTTETERPAFLEELRKMRGYFEYLILRRALQEIADGRPALAAQQIAIDALREADEALADDVGAGS